MLCCSGQCKDSEGNWVAAAIKYMAIRDEYSVEQAKRELAAMQAVQGSLHCVQLLHMHDGFVFVNGERYMCCVMR